jgi:putative dehydrogenase
MTDVVGIVGVGAMGSAIATRLLGAGRTVVGTDIVADYMTRLEKSGGRAVDSPRAVADAASVVILSLPSAAAFREVTMGPNGVGSSGRTDLTVVDTCTLDIPDKLEARDYLAERGIALLDCTLSGTPPMCLENLMTLYASGSESEYEKVAPIVRDFTRKNTYMGEFGNASRIKYVINFLVLAHGAAAAEALTFAEKLGLDPRLVQELASDSFGSSRVLERRGRLMIDGDYTSSGNSYSLARKDGAVITSWAASVGMPVPVFTAALQMYVAGMAQGWGPVDPASIYEIYRAAAGLEARSPEPTAPKA